MVLLERKESKIMHEDTIFGLVVFLTIGLLAALIGGFLRARHIETKAIIERGNVIVCPACQAPLKLVREDL